jgi:hypothetical protein
MFRLLAFCFALAATPPALAWAASGGGAPPGPAPSYLPLSTLTASAAGPGGRRGVLTVEAGLDIADARLRARADASRPRLRDAHVRFLTTYAATLRPGGPPDPAAISAALQRSTDQVLGAPGAKVLLGSIMIN